MGDKCCAQAVRADVMPLLPQQHPLAGVVCSAQCGMLLLRCGACELANPHVAHVVSVQCATCGTVYTVRHAVPTNKIHIRDAGISCPPCWEAHPMQGLIS